MFVEMVLQNTFSILENVYEINLSKKQKKKS